MRITALAGGVGGARFLRGLRAVLAGQSAEITVIGNTADDITLFGLRICPDLDTVMYTLGGGVEEAQGWGRREETFTVSAELAAYGAGPSWFRLGDRDLATHILRTKWLREGASLSQVTARLCTRWQPGVRLLPMSDDQVETHVLLPGVPEPVHFQEWWVAMHAAPLPTRFVQVGAERARPAPGVLDAIETADVVLFPPSNPVVSIGAILAVPGIREALVETSAPIIGVSPIIGGAPVRGMADVCLKVVGVPATAAGVAEWYGPQLLDGWLVDERDADTAVEGIPVRARPLLMTDVDAAAAIARDALRFAEEVRPPRG
ncbi:MAG: 2-phospho-L-lactate transferase [Acidothermus sp.]|nr:2-phospho-L-lactate transferase [Acidothermus sp.]